VLVEAGEEGAAVEEGGCPSCSQVRALHLAYAMALLALAGSPCLRRAGAQLLARAARRPAGRRAWEGWTPSFRLARVVVGRRQCVPLSEGQSECLPSVAEVTCGVLAGFRPVVTMATCTRVASASALPPLAFPSPSRDTTRASSVLHAVGCTHLVPWILSSA
jgi:hypothetical protein